MLRRTGAFIAGSVTSFFILCVLFLLGQNTKIEVFTTSEFTNFLELFCALGAGAIIAEVVCDSTALEVMLDILVAFVVACFANTLNTPFIFSGAWRLIDVMTIGLVPIVIVITFSIFGAQAATEAIKKAASKPAKGGKE